MNNDNEGVFECVTIGDVHLDALHNLFPHDGLKLQMGAVRRVLDWAITKGVPYAVFLGDIANKPILSDDGYSELVDLIMEYGSRIKLEIILGNHDIKNDENFSLRLLSKLTALGILDKVNIHSKPTQIVDPDSGVVLNMLPFPHAQALPSKKPSLNFAHIDRVGAKHDNGSVITKGNDEPLGDNTWIIGHLHTPQQGKGFYYPGTLYQLTFGEPLPKGWAHIKAKYSKTGALKVKYDWHEIRPPYTLTNLEIDTKADLKQVSDNKYDLYKLFVSRKVEMPPDFLAQHPNVVSVLGFKDDRELKSILDLASSSGTDSTEFDLRHGLDDYLEQKLGASKKQVTRANVLLDRLLQTNAV